MLCRLASLSHEVTSAEGDPTPRPSAPGPPIGGGNAARLANSSWDMHTAPLVARVHLRQAMWQWTLASEVGPCTCRSTPCTLLCAALMGNHTFFLAQCTTMQSGHRNGSQVLPSFTTPACMVSRVKVVSVAAHLAPTCCLARPVGAGTPCLLTCVLPTVHPLGNLQCSNAVPPSRCLLPLLHANAA